MQTQIHKDSWMISLGVTPVPEHLYSQRDIGRDPPGKRTYLSAEEKENIILEVEKRISKNKSITRTDLFYELVDENILPKTFSPATFKHCYTKANNEFRKKSGIRPKSEIILELWDAGMRDIKKLTEISGSDRSHVIGRLAYHGRRKPKFSRTAKKD